MSCKDVVAIVVVAVLVCQIVSLSVCLAVVASPFDPHANRIIV